MEQFVEYIVKNIVDDADSVNVTCLKGQREMLVEIRVNPEDIGKLIGRKGRTINALRTIVGMIAAKMGSRSRVELIEDSDEEQEGKEESQEESQEESSVEDRAEDQEETSEEPAE